MKNIFTLLLLITLMGGCNLKKDKTHYTIITRSEIYTTDIVPFSKIKIDSTQVWELTDSAAFHNAYHAYYTRVLIGKGIKGGMKEKYDFVLLNWERKDVSNILSESTKNNIIKLVLKDLPMDEIH